MNKMTNKQRAEREAQRRADYSNKPYRISYDGTYHVTPEDSLYDGGTVAIVHPQGELLKQSRA